MEKYKKPQKYLDKINEANEKARKFRSRHLEGGYGFNPYEDEANAVLDSLWPKMKKHKKKFVEDNFDELRSRWNTLVRSKGEKPKFAQMQEEFKDETGVDVNDLQDVAKEKKERKKKVRFIRKDGRIIPIPAKYYDAKKLDKKWR